MKDSLDFQDLKEQLVTPVPKVDLAQEETEGRGGSLETRVDPGRTETSDILGHMVRKGREDLGLCNVTWLRRSEITVLAVMVRTSALSTQLSSRLHWTHLKTLVQPLTACVTPF